MTKSKAQPARYKIIEAISAPLGFFVLALLIVETFLASILIGGRLEKPDLITGIWIGVGMFVFVTIAVWFLVWFKPQNLTFDKEAHLADKSRTSLGADSHTPKTPKDLEPTHPATNGARNE